MSKEGKLPVLSSTNYAFWKNRIKTHIISTDPCAWEVVTNGLVVPQGPISRYDSISLKNYQANAKACDIIFSTVSDGELNKISNLTDAKKIWDLLAEVHEGTTTVKDFRVTRLISQFDRLMLEPNETVSSLYDRMSTIVLGRIVSYELDQEEKRLIHGSGSSSKKNNVALKAKKSSKKIRFNKKFGSKFGNKLKYQGESSSSKFRKSAHRKKSDMAKRVCFNCGKKGHFIVECPEKADEDKEKKSFKKHSHKKNHDRHKKKDWKKDSAHKKGKYYSRAHVGEWNSDSSSSEESSDSESEGGVAGLAIAITSAREKTSLFDSADSSEDASGDDRSSPSCFMAKSSKVSSPSEEINSNDNDETDNEESEPITYERLQFIVEKQEDLLITEIKKNTNMANELKRLKSKFRAIFTSISESCSVVTNPSPSDLSLAEENAKLKKQIEAGILKCHQGTETLNQILGLQIPHRCKDGIGFQRKYNVNGDAWLPEQYPPTMFVQGRGKYIEVPPFVGNLNPRKDASKRPNTSRAYPIFHVNEFYILKMGTHEDMGA
ncbi:uncharacterized protein LOC100842250 [Brachypodium distachyon]|uniref:uncharacterized protein LOC100842250 n=1 Tax=Brachypodium distachyon TaxID=15368 RepID=UPI00052FF20A|nr:uncharacterized protein LOC100842250 [Brachypodium distachyon]|eukprot:XP_010236636.1 uncharacterized protein LOC100842250 [Brachypodium distachyon]